VNAQFRSHQISDLHTFALDKFHRRLSIKGIRRAVNLQPKAVRHALQKSSAIPKRHGEHPAVEDNTEEGLPEWVKMNAQHRTAVNRTEVLYDYRETFGAGVTDGWVGTFPGRGEAELFEMVGRPRENPRLEILRVFSDPVVECLKQHVPVCCAELVFN
jgi:hypothetical protein